MHKVAQDLFDGEGEHIVLVGGRSRVTGEIVFPYPHGAESALYERIHLQRRGYLWSWTVQRFPPKPPYNGSADLASFRPYAVGYVELPDEIIVESRMVCDDFSQLAIGMPMVLTAEPYRADAAGEPVYTFAFRPA